MKVSIRGCKTTELIRVWENPMRVRIQAVLVMLQIGVEQPERIVYCNLKLHML